MSKLKTNWDVRHLIEESLLEILLDLLKINGMDGFAEFQRVIRVEYPDSLDQMRIFQEVMNYYDIWLKEAEREHSG